MCQPPPPANSAANGSPKRELNLWDSVCLIVGIIIGAGIYQVAPDVARGTSNGWTLLALWLAGGILSLFGAMNYAELASAYPKSGGDYAYLTRAFGPWAGFLFGWMQLAIVRPGDIAVMAFAFATYARTLYDPFPPGSNASLQLYAGFAIVGLTLINILGVRQSKWTQNLLTIVKVAGLAAIAALAALAPSPPVPPAPANPLPPSLALILVLFTFGGWNEMAYVAAEVVNPRRNIARALLLGTAAVTCLYLLANAGFLHALGHAGLQASNAVAVDALAPVFSLRAGAIVAVLVCLSALGAVNGLIFAGARISYALGCDHRLFRWLGAWHARTGTPLHALVIQGAIALVLVAVLGSFTNTLLYTAAPVYLFYLSSNLAVIVLRHTEPRVERPYKVWGYPLTTLVFGGACCFLVYSAIVYRPGIALAAFALLLAGLLVFRASSHTAAKPPGH